MIVYNPRKFSCNFNGVPLSGFGGETFFKATKRNPIATLEDLGPDGEGAFVLSGDHSYDIELTLKKASPSNTILSQFATATEMGAPIVAAFTATDGSTGSNFTAEETILVEAPQLEGTGNNKLGDNVWKFVAKKGVVKHVGDAG